MITVTLQFTSIQAAVKALAAIDGGVLVGGAQVADVKTDTVTVTPVADKPTAAPGKSAQSAATPARSKPTATEAAAAAPAQSTEPPAPPSSTAETATAASAGKVEYKDLQAAVVKLHKMDPTAAIPVAKSLGFDNFKVMPAEKWAEALAAVNAAIAAKG